MEKRKERENYEEGEVYQNGEERNREEAATYVERHRAQG